MTKFISSHCLRQPGNLYCAWFVNSNFKWGLTDEYYPKISFNKPWIGYFAFNDNQVVGTGGFTGLPKEGKVEIAYWTFKEFEGQGVASFVCRQLIAIAKSADPAIIITAKTAPEYKVK